MVINKETMMAGFGLSSRDFHSCIFTILYSNILLFKWLAILTNAFLLMLFLFKAKAKAHTRTLFSLILFYEKFHTRGKEKKTQNGNKNTIFMISRFLLFLFLFVFFCGNNLYLSCSKLKREKKLIFFCVSWALYFVYVMLLLLMR